MLGFVIFICYIAFLIPIIRRAAIYSRYPGIGINWKPGIIWAVSGVAGLTIILVLLRIYTEALWFNQFGFIQRYWKVLLTRWWVFGLFGLVGFGFVWWNLKPIRSIGIVPSVERPDLSGRAAWIWLPIIIGIIFGVIGSNRWETILLYINKVSAGIFDPIFNKDISFYFFSLPFYIFLSSWLLGLFFLTLAVVEVFYIPNRFINLGVRHGTLLGAAILGVIIWKSILAQYNLVYSARGAVLGAGYADVHAQIWAYRIFAVISFGVLLCLVFGRTLKTMWSSLFGWAGAWLVIVIIYPNLVQYFAVRPNELKYELPYIKNNIKFTCLGYGITQVEEREFKSEPLSSSIISRHASTLGNIRLWDPRALLDTYKQLQEIRLYYEFSNVDIDRYSISDKYTQIMLAPRELNQAKLPEKSRTWINERFKYTHGYGVCLNPVNEFTPEGAPNLLIKDTPPKSEVPELNITRPEIYYGERTWAHVFVRTGTDEFDYSKGDENIYCQYEGNGGIPFSGFLRKLAFALRFDGIKVLLSKYLTPESRIMFNRQIGERAPKIAPFLKYDADPYFVIDKEGKLFWLWDAYTTSTRFPYSEPFVFQRDTINYIRNSVKVLIDAYNGRVKFFVFDPDDPIVKTYSNIFPSLFSKRSEFPEDLISHLRYPEDLLSLHAKVYATYHMLEPDVFYNREDVWQIAREKYMESAQPVLPYYVIASLGEEPEFIQMIPFTPLNKDNLIGWLAGRCDGENYGKLLAYKFPKEELTFGPMQIEARIDQDAEISAQLTLWGQRGSEVIRGNTLVIPLESSLLYVEPLYLQATGSRIPELRKVIVSSGERLVWADRFEEALHKLVAGVEIEEVPALAGMPARKEEANVYELIGDALRHFERYKALMGEGRFKEAGEELRELESNLKKAKELQTKVYW